MKSPTECTMDLLRKNGWIPAVVERWNAFAKVRMDLYKGIDVVALREGCNGVLGVQASSLSHISDRTERSLANRAVKLWVSCNNRFIVIGWDKKDGKFVYQYRELILVDGALSVLNSTAQNIFIAPRIDVKLDSVSNPSEHDQSDHNDNPD